MNILGAQAKNNGQHLYPPAMQLFTFFPKITGLLILTNKLVDDSRFGSASLKRCKVYKEALLLINGK